MLGYFTRVKSGQNVLAVSYTTAYSLANSASLGIGDGKPIYEIDSKLTLGKEWHFHLPGRANGGVHIWHQ